MPRPLLQHPKQETINLDRLSTTSKTEARQNLLTDPARIKQILRKRRSQAYMDAIQKLDAGGYQHDPQLAKLIVQAIKDEFPDIAIESVLLGCMAICHLGHPMEIHTIETDTPTIVHVPKRYHLGPALDKARSLALMPDYLCIEIYSHELRAISKTGSVAIIDAPSAEDDWNQYQSEPTVSRPGCDESFT